MEPSWVTQLRQVCLLGRLKTSHNFWDPHPIVGLSSLLFALPAIVFFSVLATIVNNTSSPLDHLTVFHLWSYAILGVLFTCIIVTSALADCVFIKRGHRSRYGAIDVVTALTTFWVCIVDFASRAPPLEVLIVTFMAIIAHVFSGMATSFEQWVWRHCLWHVVAAAVPTYGALRCPPAEALIRDRLPMFVVYVGIAYTLTVMVVSLVCCMLPRAALQQFWEMGARHAHWQPLKSNSSEEEVFSSSSRSRSSSDSSSDSNGPGLCP